MATLSKLWAGRIYGTNTGNVSVKLDNTEGDLKGELKIADDRWGIASYKISGSFDGAKLSFKGNSGTAPDGIATGELTIEGALDADGSVKGEWSSTLGTGGSFILHPHTSPDEVKRTPTSALPEQLYTVFKNIGVLKLSAEDVRDLIEHIKRDFSSGTRIVANYHDRGNEISKYAPDFESDFSRLHDLKYLRLHIQEAEAYGIAKSATVTVNSDGQNEIRTQGIQETWVSGKAETLNSFLKSKEKPIATLVRKYGLSLNVLIAIIAISALPELPFWRRVVFSGFIVLVWLLVQRLHRKYVPNVSIFLSPQQTTLFSKAWPQVLLWGSTILSGIIVAAVYGLLKGEISLHTWLGLSH